MMMSVTNINT